jgi:hypothetical protein
MILFCSSQQQTNKEHTMAAQSPNLINMTPHTINVFRDDGTVEDIPSSGIIRVASTQVKVCEIRGIPVYKTIFGEVIGLPPKRIGIFYVVSRLVLSACPERDDLLAPGTLVRDDKGQPIGCKGLVID